MAGKWENPFTQQVESALSEKKYASVLKLCKDPKNTEEIKSNSWDLIPIIAKHLSIENRNNDHSLFTCCLQLLNVISKQSNAEEVLLQFIAEIEEAKDNTKVCSLMAPLFETLRRIQGKKKITSLSWSCNAIETYLKNFELPDYYNLEGKERLLVDHGDVVNNILMFYQDVIVFYEELLKHVIEETDKGARQVVNKFLIQLLGTPLCYINMELYEGNIESDARSTAAKIIVILLKNQNDPFKTIKLRHEKEHDEFVMPNTLSIASLLYVICGEGIGLDLIPKVYDAIYIFESTLHLMCSLFQSNHIILCEKGLKLFQYVRALLQGRQLDFLQLNCDDHKEFCKVIEQVIVFNSSKSVRTRALETFTSYLELFEIKGIYLIIFHSFEMISHSGLKGYLITFYKDLLRKDIDTHPQILNEHFKGTKLSSLLNKFCQLPDNEKTDLLQKSDHIISCMNLIRYIAIRDKDNLTGLKDVMPTLEASYLEPLRKGLELSKAHYELEIKNIHEEKNETKTSGADFSVSVSGETLPHMDKEEKLRVLNSALITFDVINSLLSRVVELFNTVA